MRADEILALERRTARVGSRMLRPAALLVFVGVLGVLVSGLATLALLIVVAALSRAPADWIAIGSR